MERAKFFICVWFYVSDETEGEVWRWSLLGMKGLNCQETIQTQTPWNQFSASTLGCYTIYPSCNDRGLILKAHAPA